MRIVFRKNRSAHLAVLVLALAGMVGLPFSSTQAASPWRVSSVPLAGLNGGSNNVAFAFDRFALVSPYAPSEQIDENSGPDRLDNHYLHLVDTKKPLAGLQSASLETATGGKTVYYPTKVLFDPNSRIAYVRGTRFEQQDGAYEPIEAIAYVRLNLDDNGKAVFNPAATVIDIKGVGASEHCSDAPTDFALGQDGKLLVFTNGASIFSYNVDQGYIYRVEIVPEAEYNEDSRIVYLDVDEATDIVTVYWNKKVKGDEGSFNNTSELSFYHLTPEGSLNIVKRVYPDQFLEGTSMIAGSSVAITAGGDKGSADFAYFVTSDGSLCQVELTSAGHSALIKQIRKFDELAQSGEDASPRIVKIDSAKRVIGIVKQGFTAQIRRPTNGRPGRPIVRSLSTFKPIEPPAFALVKLGKKSKVISSKVFVDGFSEEEGLTSFVPSGEGQWLISTHSGNLYSVGIADDPQKTDFQLMALLGPRTDQIAFLSARSSVVAINSFELNESGDQIMAPGSLVVAKMSDVSSQSGGMSLQSLSVTSQSSVSKKKISQGLLIRRPCNDKKSN